MDERMLITNLKTWNPPITHIGLVPVRNVNASPASYNRLVRMIEILEPMQIMQIPSDTCVFAVDFQGVKGFVAACIAGRLEESERAVIEVAEERASVVDVDGGLFAGLDVGSFFDERFGHCADIVDRTVDP